MVDLDYVNLFCDLGYYTPLIRLAVVNLFCCSLGRCSRLVGQHMHLRRSSRTWSNSFLTVTVYQQSYITRIPFFYVWNKKVFFSVFVSEWDASCLLENTSETLYVYTEGPKVAATVGVH